MKRELRADQMMAVENLREAYREGKRRVMINAPTGWGKTIFAAHLTESAQSRRRRVLFTVPTIELVNQTVERFWEQGIRDVGVIQADHPNTDWAKPIQVASVQTLQKKSILPEFDLCLIDEAHVWFQFYDRLFTEAGRKLIAGFSATPFTKGLGAPGRYDHLQIAMTTAEAIQKGLLSDFRVIAPTHPDLSGVKTVAGDYHEGQLSQFMRQETLVGDCVENWLKHGKGRPTLAYGVDRAHAELMCQKFKDAGIQAGYMDCFTLPCSRSQIKKDFADRKIEVVWNVDTLTTGVDWDVRCEVMARPTKSAIRFIQIVGRSLRTAKDKDYALIIDHTDNHLKRFGYVTDIVCGDLDDGQGRGPAEKKIEVKLPAECPRCHMLRIAQLTKCPNCGYVAERTTRAHWVDGDLAHYSPRDSREEVLRRDLMIKGSEAPAVVRRAWWGMLLSIRDEKGKSDKWALAQFRERFGVWPHKYYGTERLTPDKRVRDWVKSRQIAWAKSHDRGRADSDYLPHSGGFSSLASAVHAKSE